jgi:hypothetical protein
MRFSADAGEVQAASTKTAKTRIEKKRMVTVLGEFGPQTYQSDSILHVQK